MRGRPWKRMLRYSTHLLGLMACATATLAAQPTWQRTTNYPLSGYEIQVSTVAKRFTEGGPVARITVSPLTDFPGITNLIVNSANGLDAEVVLDGSQSSDPDGDPLAFTWMEAQAVLGTAAIITNRLALGTHEIALVVSDGKASATATVTVEVAMVAGPSVILLSDSRSVRAQNWFSYFTNDVGEVDEYRVDTHNPPEPFAGWDGGAYTSIIVTDPTHSYAARGHCYCGQQSPNGTWSLYVEDAAAQDQGTIAGGWDLTIATTPSSPPTLSSIPDQSLVINTVSTPIPFLVGDDLTMPDDLVVTGSSSNPVLLPDEHIVLGGSGPNRTVTLTPVAGQTGSATITLSVTNRTQLGVSTSFALTVNPDGAVMTFANSAAITIPGQGAATPYPSTIQVSGLSGTVSKVTATPYNFTHTWPHDVGVLLVSPSGEATLLLADVGGGNPARNVTLDFEDAAPASLTQQLIVPGTYRPTSNASDPFPPGAPAGPYPASLSVFNGITPNGTWSLYVADDAANDSGTIANGWSVTLYTAESSPGLLSTRFSPRASGTGDSSWAAPASASRASAWIESMTVWPDGQVHLIIRGQPGQGYTVQASSTPGDWQDIFTHLRPGAAFEFSDPHGRDYPQRFYRVKVLDMTPASSR